MEGKYVRLDTDSLIIHKHIYLRSAQKFIRHLLGKQPQQDQGDGKNDTEHGTFLAVSTNYKLLIT